MMKKLILMPILFLFVQALCAQDVTTLRVTKEKYEHFDGNPLPIWGSMQGKMKMPIDFSTTDLGKLDTIDFNFYGMSLLSYENAEPKKLSVGAFVYPFSEEFPSKRIKVRQKTEGSEGSRICIFQYDVEFTDLPDTMSYQIAFNELSKEISFHYGNMPLVNKVDSMYAGIFGEILSTEEIVFLHLLEGSPENPESFYSFVNPYQYLNNCPSDSLKYTFGGLIAGMDKNVSGEKFWLEHTESGFRIPSRNLAQTATLYALDGRVVSRAKLVGGYLFFDHIKDLPKGVYAAKIVLNDGRESSLK